MKFKIFSRKENKCKKSADKFVQVNMFGKTHDFAITESTTALDVLKQIEQTQKMTMASPSSSSSLSSVEHKMKMQETKKDKVKQQEKQHSKHVFSPTEGFDTRYIALLLDSTVLALSTHLMYFANGPLLTLGMSSDVNTFGPNALCISIPSILSDHCLNIPQSPSPLSTIEKVNNSPQPIAQTQLVKANENKSNVMENHVAKDKSSSTQRHDSHESSESRAALSSSQPTSEVRSVSCEMIMKEVQENLQLRSHMEREIVPVESNHVISANREELHNSGSETTNKGLNEVAVLQSLASTRSTNCDYHELYSPKSESPDYVVLSPSIPPPGVNLYKKVQHKCKEKEELEQQQKKQNKLQKASYNYQEEMEQLLLPTRRQEEMERQMRIAERGRTQRKSESNGTCETLLEPLTAVESNCSNELYEERNKKENKSKTTFQGVLRNIRSNKAMQSHKVPIKREEEDKNNNEDELKRNTHFNIRTSITKHPNAKYESTTNTINNKDNNNVEKRRQSRSIQDPIKKEREEKLCNSLRASTVFVHNGSGWRYVGESQSDSVLLYQHNNTNNNNLNYCKNSMVANNFNYRGNDKISANVCSECKRAKRLPSNAQCNLAQTYQDHYNSSNNKILNNECETYSEHYNTPLCPSYRTSYSGPSYRIPILSQDSSLLPASWTLPWSVNEQQQQQHEQQRVSIASFVPMSYLNSDEHIKHHDSCLENNKTYNHATCQTNKLNMGSNPSNHLYNKNYNNVIREYGPNGLTDNKHTQDVLCTSPISFNYSTNSEHVPFSPYVKQENNKINNNNIKKINQQEKDITHVKSNDLAERCVNTSHCLKPENNYCNNKSYYNNNVCEKHKLNLSKPRSHSDNHVHGNKENGFHQLEEQYYVVNTFKHDKEKQSLQTQESSTQSENQSQSNMEYVSVRSDNEYNSTDLTTPKYHTPDANTTLPFESPDSLIERRKGNSNHVNDKYTKSTHNYCDSVKISNENKEPIEFVQGASVVINSVEVKKKKKEETTRANKETGQEPMDENRRRVNSGVITTNTNNMDALELQRCQREHQKAMEAEWKQIEQQREQEAGKELEERKSKNNIHSIDNVNVHKSKNNSNNKEKNMKQMCKLFLNQERTLTPIVARYGRSQSSTCSALQSANNDDDEICTKIKSSLLKEQECKLEYEKNKTPRQESKEEQRCTTIDKDNRYNDNSSRKLSNYNEGNKEREVLKKEEEEDDEEKEDTPQKEGNDDIQEHDLHDQRRIQRRRRPRPRNSAQTPQPPRVAAFITNEHLAARKDYIFADHPNYLYENECFVKCDEAFSEHFFHHHHHHHHHHHGHNHQNTSNNNKCQKNNLSGSINENSNSNLVKKNETNKLTIICKNDNNDFDLDFDKVFMNKCKKTKDDGNYEGNVPHADGVQPLSANVFSVGTPQLNDTMG